LTFLGSRRDPRPPNRTEAKGSSRPACSAPRADGQDDFGSAARDGNDRGVSVRTPRRGGLSGQPSLFAPGSEGGFLGFTDGAGQGICQVKGRLIGV